MQASPPPQPQPLHGHLILPLHPSAGASTRLPEEAPGVTEAPCAPFKQFSAPKGSGGGAESAEESFLHVNTRTGLLERLFSLLIFISRKLDVAKV